MPLTEYVVRSRSRNGRLVESTVKAFTETEALTRTRQLGLTPLMVEAKPSSGLNMEIRIGKGKVKPKDLALFSRQFATMLAAGLPILRSLTILGEQSDSLRLREILSQVREDVEQGMSLSGAMGEHREFPPLMVAMVEAGEVGGFLETSMVRIAESLESDVILRSKIKSALTYPVAVGVIAVLIVTGMLIFVVPIFEQMFASFGGELPAPTQLLVNLSALIKNPLFFIPLLAVIIGGTMLYRRNKHRRGVRNVMDPLKFRIPIFGKLFHKVALARFTRSLSTLLAAGVPILQSLDIVGDTAGNVLVSRATESVKESVRQGTGMSRPLAEHPIFPEMVVQMIAVGEDTGALDEMLDKVADFYDQEVEATTEQLMALIEPIMIMVLGGIVGGMIIALYLPMFKIFEYIQ